MESVKFYKVNEPFGVFSNFYHSPIYIKGDIWPTVEHYFQACKFEDWDLKDKIKFMDSPMDAAKEGRKIENKLVHNWETIKDQAMYTGVKAKFLQHHNMKCILLNTGHKNIIEHTVNDRYWGDGGDGSGENKLGLILMQVRWELNVYKNDLILPPWIAFPGLSKDDLFWRMGIGENYMNALFKFLYNYGTKKYLNEFEVPEEWKSFTNKSN